MSAFASRHGVSVSLLVALAACGGGAPEAGAGDSTAAAPPVQVNPAMVASVDSVLIESGPVVSGTMVAEREAQLRAQVGGTVLALMVREGDQVRAGQALAVIDTTVLADQARSARLGLASAELAATTAERNAERSTQLLAAGAVAPREVENARDMVAQSRAVVEDARARVAAAEKQLANATVRAPFAGVVSQLSVSQGDVVQMNGAQPLAVVIDPRVLELEASVPAASLGAVVRGAAVEFSVPSQPGKRIRGTVARINPAIDPATGQVRVYVRVPNDAGALVAGLFAEGRVAVEAHRALAIPLHALDTRATDLSVRRVRGGVVEQVGVTLGLRDELAERVEVTSGLTAGDTVLVGGALGTPVGATVRILRTDG
ncbi:MAG TPA: efflux RND transporter periplasmic adaptor subunit [Gemmatimonadales bacterium]|nr:efflux RND transporter periplasmic adaptor subunit [Gemmatimonadales bacterium]